MIGQRKRRISSASEEHSDCLTDADSEYSEDDQPAMKRRRADELFEELRLWREAREKFRLEFMELMRSYNEKVDRLAEMLLKSKANLDNCDK